MAIPPTRQLESSIAGMTHALVIHRKSFEFEDASSLQSLYPSSPTENGTESQPKFGSKSTLEENAYEDIVGKLGQSWWAGSSLGAAEQAVNRRPIPRFHCIHRGQTWPSFWNFSRKWAPEEVA